MIGRNDMESIRRINENLLIIEGNIPSIRYTARRTTLGTEYAFVQEFLKRVIEYINCKSTFKTAIFIEPQLDSGYPDIVIIQYSLTTTQSLYTERTILTNTHLKVLCEVDKQKRISITRLSSILGFDLVALTGIVGELEEAGLVRCRARSVERAPYKDYFCIKKIIAIEAKIDKWSIAIEQAVHNTRFADESYVLMKRDKCNTFTEKRCNDLGVGVLLMNGNIHRAVKASRDKFAKPYITFLFNEWIQQIERMEGQK